MFLKRLIDILTSLIGLLLMSPALGLILFFVWLQDFHSPFYIAPRVGKNGKIFNMVKLRSMVVDADNSGIYSTAADDKRITKIGHIIRRYKLDEFSQLWNVILGQMSLVGPRPQVKREVDLYTDEERRLLDVRPGITDFSSIIFSDEGDILAGSDDPDLKYNQIIRPWKSRFGLLYIQNKRFMLDVQLIFLTIIAMVSRPLALQGAQKILLSLEVDNQLLAVAGREKALEHYPPPGADHSVKRR